MLARFLTRKTNNTLIQFFRYTFVGAAAWLVDIGALYAFTEYANIYYLISAVLAFILGLTVNYTISVTWVFSRRTIDNRSAEFLIFALIGVVGLAFNVLFMWLFTEKVGFH